MLIKKKGKSVGETIKLEEKLKLIKNHRPELCGAFHVMKMKGKRENVEKVNEFDDPIYCG